MPIVQRDYYTWEEALSVVRKKFPMEDSAENLLGLLRAREDVASVFDIELGTVIPLDVYFWEIARLANAEQMGSAHLKDWYDPVAGVANCRCDPPLTIEPNNINAEKTVAYRANGQVRILREELDAELAKADTTASTNAGREEPQTKKRGAGRLPQYEWDEFWREVVRIANTSDGLPKTQAELVKHMANWCLNKWGREPSLSVIKEKLQPLKL